MPNYDKEIQNLKTAVREQAKEIDRLRDRTTNIEKWIDELVKWVDGGIEMFEKEVSNISFLKLFLESWSK